MSEKCGSRERDGEAQEAFRALVRCEKCGREPRTADERAALVAVSVLLCEGKTGAVDAVREIYGRARKRGEVDALVVAYCAERFLDRATVYRWLRTAREIYGAVRNPRR